MNKNKKNTLKFTQIINKPVIKGIGLCALVGVSVLGGFTIGKQVGLESPATSKYYSSNKKIATVNGFELSANDFKASMNILFHLKKNEKLSEEEISKYENQLLEYNTTSRAIYDVAVKAGIKADEESVQLNYTSIIDELKEMLSMEEEEILKKFNLTQSGIKENLREEYIVNKYLEVESEVSDEDALKYYTENPDEFYKYRASHILISTTDSSDQSLSDEDKAKAKAKAEELLKQVKAGKNFEELAKENSQDGSAQDGGDLGFFGKGEMVSEFETAVSNTEIGQIHPEIVETRYGYHIIKRTGETTESFEDSKENIISQLSYDMKSKLIDKITKEADIKIHYKN